MFGTCAQSGSSLWRRVDKAVLVPPILFRGVNERGWVIINQGYRGCSHTHHNSFPSFHRCSTQLQDFLLLFRAALVVPEGNGYAPCVTCTHTEAQVQAIDASVTSRWVVCASGQSKAVRHRTDNASSYGIQSSFRCNHPLQRPRLRPSGRPFPFTLSR